VFDDLAPRHIDYLLAYISHVIGNALKVLQNKQPLRSALNGSPVSPHHLNHLLVKLVIKRVNLVVARNRLSRSLRVARRESVKPCDEHLLNDFCHSIDVYVHVELRLVVERARVLGNVYGMIGNALYDGRGVRDRNHKPEVACGGLPQRQYVNAHLVYLKLQLVNRVVFSDDALGYDRIALRKRANRKHNGFFCRSAHYQHAVAQQCEILFNKSIVHLLPGLEFLVSG
jgi:hypothetical protein